MWGHWARWRHPTHHEAPAIDPTQLALDVDGGVDNEAGAGEGGQES